MRITAYRLTQTRYFDSAFDGEGARLNGGRWNSPGTRMVYTAGSLSLATLELLVHTEDISILFGRYSVIPVQFEEALVQKVLPKALPKRWDSPQPLAKTQILGDRWIQSGSFAVLEMPSAVTRSESNYLLNPAHPDFSKIGIQKSFLFQPDTRLRNSSF